MIKERAVVTLDSVLATYEVPDATLVELYECPYCGECIVAEYDRPGVLKCTHGYAQSSGRIHRRFVCDCGTEMKKTGRW
jgi:hypothetical protein